MLVRRSSKRRNGAKTLSQLMAESRSNPKRRKSRKKTTRRKARRNESPKTLSQLLAESRSNPKRRKTRKKTTRRKTRRNAATTTRTNPASASHKALIADVNKARKRLIAARAKYKQSGRPIDKANVARAENQLKREEKKVKDASRKLASALKSLKSTSPKRKTRKKTTSRKTTSRKRKNEAIENPRKKKRRSVKVGSAQNTDAYKKLRSTATKTRFTIAFNKAFKAAKRRGLTAADAHRRATAAGRAAVKRGTRKNPAAKTGLMRIAANPARKSRKTRKKKTASRVKVGSAQNTDAYKKLRSTATKTRFTIAFNKTYKSLRRRGIVASDAHRRATAAGRAAVKRGTRKNPAHSTPKTGLMRKNAPRRARAKRLRRGMSKQAEKVLGSYGPYSVSYMRNGKVITIRAQKSSADYKRGKSKGLTGIYRRLDGKKNTPTSLNLRSVYKVTKGDKPSKAEMQRALNIWAGAIDGGKVKGVTKRDIRKTARRNPGTRAMTHTVGRPNPGHMGLMRVRPNESPAQVYGVGAVSGITSLYLSNLVSSSLGLGFQVDAADKADGSFKYYAAQLLPLAGVGAVFGTALYRKYNEGQMLSEKNTAMAIGAVAGSLYSALARMVFQNTLGKLPGLSALSKSVGDEYTYAPTTDAEDNGAAPAAARYLVDNQNRDLGFYRGGMGLMRRNGNHTGRYVRTTGRYVRTNPGHTGRYVRSNGGHMGRYVRTNGEHMGVYRPRSGMIDGMHRSNPVAPSAAHRQIGADVQVSPVQQPLGEAQAFDYNINLKGLKDDIDLIEGLTFAELQAEGVAEVIDYGDNYKVVRATPDVARQIVEANFGSLLGQSQVVDGAVLVLAAVYDDTQNHALTDKLRLGTAPALPKGAAYPQPNGVFSRVSNTSLFPSVDNGAAYQEFGVKV